MTIGLDEIKDHVGHDIVCVQYGNGENYAIECETCGIVLFDSWAFEGDSTKASVEWYNEAMQYDG